jgi:hypothetical protein
MIVSACAPWGGQTAATERLITMPATVPDKRSSVGAGPAQLTPVTRAVSSNRPEPSSERSDATALLQGKSRRTSDPRASTKMPRPPH